MVVAVGLVASPYKAAYVSAKHGIAGLTKATTAVTRAHSGVATIGLAIAFLGVVATFFFGPEIKGARRWLDLGPLVEDVEALAVERARLPLADAPGAEELPTLPRPSVRSTSLPSTVQSTIRAQPGRVTDVASNAPAGATIALPDAGIADAEYQGLVKNLGHLLFTKYVLPFEISSILFIAAMVGAGDVEDAFWLLSDYSWPGNIRQLANVLRRAVVEPRIGRDAGRRRGRTGRQTEVV